MLAMGEDDHGVIPKGRSAQDRRGERKCPVSSAQLASSANGAGNGATNGAGNGEGYLTTVATYLTESACTDDSYHISSEAISTIKFKDTGPYGFLKQNANSLVSARFENVARVETQVKKRLPQAFSEAPLASSDLAIVAQLAVLSPRLGKQALGQVIQTELSRENQPELAQRLIRYGAALEPIAIELAEGVQEMTISGQGDSLGNLLNNLSLAATNESSLIPTFNTVAAAVRTGVVRAEKVYEKNARLTLSSAVFWGISGATLGAPGLEPGMISLNDALAILTKSSRLRIQDKMVKPSVLILAKTNTQPALARSLASSMTPTWLSWSGRDRELLLAAGGQYFELALALQEKFIQLVDKKWNEAGQGDVAGFNETKKSVLVPLGEAIIGIDPDFICPEFVSILVKNNLVSDTLIEQRLPKLVLDRYHHDSELHEILATDKTSEPLAQALFSQLANSMALQLTYIPALNGWIERQSK